MAGSYTTEVRTAGTRQTSTAATGASRAKTGTEITDAKRSKSDFYQRKKSEDSNTSVDTQSSGQLLVLDDKADEEELELEEGENEEPTALNTGPAAVRSRSTVEETIRSLANSSPSLVSIKFFQDPPPLVQSTPLHQQTTTTTSSSSTITTATSTTLPSSAQQQQQQQQHPNLSALTSVMTADTPASLAQRETTGRVRNSSIKINRPRSQSTSTLPTVPRTGSLPQILPKPPGMLVCQPSYPFMVPPPTQSPITQQQPQQKAIFHPYRHPSIRPKPQTTDGFINCTHLYASQAQKMPLPPRNPPAAFVQLHRPMMVPNLRALAPMPPPKAAVPNEPDSVLKLFSEAADIHERQHMEKALERPLEKTRTASTTGPRKILPKGPEALTEQKQ